MKHYAVLIMALLVAAGISLYPPPPVQDVHAHLTSMQYYVTQQDGTEPAWNNEYWDNKEPGIYVDVVDGTPLYSSTHKYDSNTGWPSFYQAISEDMIVRDVDYKLGYPRVEARSATGHLGHIFRDGPEPTGERHCINSAALRFVALEDMEEEGYSEYLYLFD